MFKKYNELLHNVRIHEGLTQEQFSEKIGVSRSTIAKIESFRQDVSNKLLKKITEIYPETVSNISEQITNISDIDSTVQKTALAGSYPELSEIHYKKLKLSGDLKDESKLFMISYRQRLLDSLQLLMSLCKALKYLGYKFSRKEVEELIFFDNDFLKTVQRIEKGETILTMDLKNNLISILDNNLFGIINKYTYKIDTLIGDDGVQEWEDLLIKK